MTTRKMVLAEDDRDLALALAWRCRALGFEVRTAGDALTALNMIARDPPDLLCLDFNMPGGSGLAACEMVATNAELRGMPTIILTGSSDEAMIRRCHELCVYYVLKCPDVWQRLEPLILELFGAPNPGDLVVTGATSPPDLANPHDPYSPEVDDD
jgi:CheY-like chemotaxis protein